MPESLRSRKLRRRGDFRAARSLERLGASGDQLWARHLIAADKAFRRRAREVAEEQGLATEGVQHLLSDEALLRALAWYLAERAAADPGEAVVVLRMVPAFLAQARACARDAWELAQREGERVARGESAQTTAFRALTEGTVPATGQVVPECATASGTTKESDGG